MSEKTLQELLENLADITGSEQKQIIVALVHRGQKIVPELIAYLEKTIDDKAKILLLSVLIKLQDKRCEDIFKQQLSAENENVRSLSAQGLVAIHSSQALEACIKTIDDAADFAHGDVTPSVLSLANIGEDVLLNTLPLLNNENSETRQHAQKVFELVSYNKVNNLYKPRALSDVARHKWNELWETNGAYHWGKPEQGRLLSMELWKRWIESN